MLCQREFAAQIGVGPPQWGIASKKRLIANMLRGAPSSTAGIVAKPLSHCFPPLSSGELVLLADRALPSSASISAQQALTELGATKADVPKRLELSLRRQLSSQAMLKRISRLLVFQSFGEANRWPACRLLHAVVRHSKAEK
jgi:hypothetical protein